MNSWYRKDAAPTNPRGIPYAPFVDKVEEYITSREDVQATLRSFQEMISYVVTLSTQPLPPIERRRSYSDMINSSSCLGKPCWEIADTGFCM